MIVKIVAPHNPYPAVPSGVDSPFDAIVNAMARIGTRINMDSTILPNVASIRKRGLYFYDRSGEG
jgi:hypothetical protein